jgi:hypothetical protein
MSKDGARRLDVSGELEPDGVLQTARLLGALEPSELGSYAIDLERAAFNYRMDVAAPPANRVRKQMEAASEAAQALRAALEGFDDTTKATFTKFWRELRPNNGRQSWRDIHEIVTWISMTTGLVAKQPAAGISDAEMPGVIGERSNKRSPAVKRLGRALARIYAAHHKSGEFRLGEQNQAEPYWFKSPAFDWFMAAARLIAPDLSNDELSNSAKEGRAALNKEAGE